MKNKINTVINYCSNDNEFIIDVVKAAKKISEKVIVVAYDCFLDGEKDEKLLIKDIEECGADFLLLNFKSFTEGKNVSFRDLHNICRKQGTSYLASAYNERVSEPYILYLDSDEIIEVERFLQWWENVDKVDSYSFANYWYFRSKEWVAEYNEANQALVKASKVNEKNLSAKDERWGLTKNNNMGRCFGLDGKPMIHHYSWAKGSTDEECKLFMLKKVRCWGHSGDKNWNNLIEEEFSRPFNGRDFVHNYKFKKIEK